MAVRPQRIAPTGAISGGRDITLSASSARLTRRPSPQSVDYDVVVAGAGPAGTAAAITLSGRGLRVVLIDQRTFPRDKVCGDFVSPVAVQQLQALGLARKHAIAHGNRIHNAAVFVDGEHLLTQAIPISDRMPVGRVVERMRLDHSLLERARSVGAEIRMDCRVTSFKCHPNLVEVSMRCSRTDEHITARVLIGADGSNSAIARCMQGSGPDDDDRSVAVRGYFEGVEGPADRADLYFGSDSFPGYCWLFPLKDGGANVGLGMLRNTLPPNREHLRTQLQHMISSDVELRRRLGRARPISNIVGWPLTTYNGDRPLVDDRVLLVGDAAGLINPINGEGIQYALQSGIWAAETVIDCAAQGDFSRSALLPFAHRVAEELGRDFAVTRALVQLIRNQSLNPLWLRALRLIAGRAAADPNYARVVGGVLAGTIPARDVIDVEIIRKTLEHSAVKAGAEILATPLTVNGLLQAGIKATQFATEAASTMLHDQAGLERWLLELAARGGDLLTTGQQRNRMEKDRVQ